jgi:hypothetical protein
VARDAKLYGDDELRVLWLTRGKQELALSVEGLWLRTGRRSAELVWDELDQIQATRVGQPWMAPRVRVEVFRTDGSAYTVGPFPSAAAERWLRACAQAAAEHGETLLPVADGIGFARVETRPNDTA